MKTADQPRPQNRSAVLPCNVYRESTLVCSIEVFVSTAASLLMLRLSIMSRRAVFPGFTIIAKDRQLLYIV